MFCLVSCFLERCDAGSPAGMFSHRDERPCFLLKAASQLLTFFFFVKTKMCSLLFLLDWLLILKLANRLVLEVAVTKICLQVTVSSIFKTWQKCCALPVNRVIFDLN